MKFAERYPGFVLALTESGLNKQPLSEIQREIFRVYDVLAEPLPDSSKWKIGKPAHARKALEEVRAFADLLGLSEPLTQYIALACSAHDLGRMTQANKRAGTQSSEFSHLSDAAREVPYDDNDERHGYESALLLRPILGSYSDTSVGKWLLDAVVHHSLKNNPTLEMCGGSEESLALCGIVRDIDKVLGFQEAGNYTNDTQRKAQERLQNWGRHLEQDPEWGTELGTIDPAIFLTGTPLEQPIDRQKCRSYEAYMLQFLKWIFGFMSTEMQEVALNEGGPQIVASYLLKQLERTPEQRAHLLHLLQSYRAGALITLPPGQSPIQCVW